MLTRLAAFILTCGVALAAERPNVLLVAIDDLNDYISPLDNHPGIQTPNFERLAERSVTFTNAHCAAPACHPSRVALMTGVHPTRSGIYGNLLRAHGPRWRHESPLLEDAVALSQHFRDHGYRAVGGGKLFHALQWMAGDSQNDPDAWDDYFGDPLDPVAPYWPRPDLTPDEQAGVTKGRPYGKGQNFGAAPLEVPDEETGDHMVVDWAIEQLQRPQDKPLFLAVGLFRPHCPFEAPVAYFDRYPLDSVQLPAHRADDLDDAHPPSQRAWHGWVQENDLWQPFVRGYLASVTYADHQLGRLLDAFDASPLKGKTIIVVLSDHGYHCGEKEAWEKFALWDQTTHVPLFIHAPGVSRDGARTRQPATLTDIYPTLCELAGLPIPEQCDGASLAQQVQTPEKLSDRTSLTAHVFRGDKAPSLAVSDARYRYIHYPDGFEELYDREKDPNEFTNRADDPALAEVKARLKAALPSETAPIRRVPKDSPYNQRRD